MTGPQAEALLLEVMFGDITFHDLTTRALALGLDPRAFLDDGIDVDVAESGVDESARRHTEGTT